MFGEEDLQERPRDDDARGRSVLEQMIHQCLSEDAWFKSILGIDVGASPVPAEETIIGFVSQYSACSRKRLEALGLTDESWWEEEVKFFDTRRSRAWVMVRRIAHTSHHRGQQMAMLRMLGREIYSNYGPTADTGGLAANGGVVVYAYRDEEGILRGGEKARLPEQTGKGWSERPAD